MKKKYKYISWKVVKFNAVFFLIFCFVILLGWKETLVCCGICCNVLYWVCCVICVLPLLPLVGCDVVLDIGVCWGVCCGVVCGFEASWEYTGLFVEDCGYPWPERDWDIAEWVWDPICLCPGLSKWVRWALGVNVSLSRWSIKPVGGWLQVPVYISI